MDFPIKSAAPVSQRTACAILPLFDKSPLPKVTREFDKATGGRLRKLLRAGEVSGKLGRAHIIHDPTGTKAQRILLVGCGPRDQHSGKSLSKAVASAVQLLRDSAIRDAINYLALELPEQVDAYYGSRISVEAARAATYTFAELKSQPDSESKLRRMGIAAEPAAAAEARRGVTHGIAIANGTDTARDLGNRPANVCTPSHIADVARSLAKSSTRLKVKVLDEREMRRLKMGSLLSVTRGATEPARLIVMQYKGAGNDTQPIALCGKGITFDTGGISLKPPPKMDEMKFDMCGAAAVIGAMQTISELEPEINVVAVVPACENMPSGEATRPGDIVTSMSGKTIEILNTDAEGRLVLCDAITYAQTFDPSCIIDVATLTGACVIALGGVYAGVFANDEDLSQRLTAAGKRSLDIAWPLPVDAEYGESLTSNFADFANVGAREGGASIAASFLSKFVDAGRPWSHLDIAGVAWKADRNKGATGRPVPLLVDFLINA
jgi:leucyl aminopeptidase